MGLAARAQLFDQDVRSISSAQGGADLGQIAETSDGRVFAYGQAGASNLSPGKLNQGVAATANHVNRSLGTYVAGTNQISVTVGATAVTANQYAQGFAVVNAGTGAGQALLISGNTACSSSGTTVVNLADAIITATATADSKVSLVPNGFANVVIADHTASTAVLPAGVANVAITAAYFGWLQVGGPASVLANGTPASGGSVIPSATTDGAVDVDLAASVQPKVGYCYQTAVSTEYRLVVLTINPR